MSEGNTAQEWESREVSSSGEQQKSQKRKKKGMTFTLRVTLTFVIVSLMTIFSAVAMLSFVWEQHFQSYTRENMERLANSTADSIAVAYERYHGDWYGSTLAAASSAGSLYDTVSIQVTNESGSVVYDNTNDQGKPAFTNFNEVEKNTAIAPIIVQGKQVGTVYVRAFGSGYSGHATRSRFQDEILSSNDFCFSVRYRHRSSCRHRFCTCSRFDRSIALHTPLRN